MHGSLSPVLDMVHESEDLRFTARSVTSVDIQQELSRQICNFMCCVSLQQLRANGNFHPPILLVDINDV